MMAKLLFNSVLVLLLQCASSQLVVDPKPHSSNNPGEVPDPVSTLLTDLGLLILDVDEAFSEHTAPKVEVEDRVKEQMYGRPRSDYFSRIRENYKILQRRVGSMSFGDAAVSVSSKLFGLNVKNEGQKSSVDVSVPSLPVQIRLRSQNPAVKESYSQMSDTVEEPAAKGLEKIQLPESSFSGKIKMGDAEMNIYSTFTVSPDKSLESKQDKPLMGYLVQMGGPGITQSSRKERSAPIFKRASDDLVSSFAQNYRQFLSNPDTESENIKNEDTKVILDDFSYSKSEAETRIKEALRNAKLALDSDLPPSEIIDKLDDVAKLVLARRRKPARKIVSDNGTSEVNPGGDADSTRKGRFERSADQEPTDFAKSNGGSDEKVAETEFTKENRTEAMPYKETILSAYTNSGIPVKLRIGPEAGDPYRFLHRILSLHEVTLSVYVSLKDDVKPIGKETPKSGSENSELPSDALYIDLSDESQRNSFLKTLRKFRS